MADKKGIQVRVDDEQVFHALDRIEKATENRLDAENAIAGYLVTSTQRRFEKSVDPDGKPWKRLKPRTAAKRINGAPRGYDNILRVTRRLEQSIFSQVEDHEIRIGTNVVYAAIHHLGGTIEMPERDQTIYQHYDKKTDTFDQRFRKRGRSNFARDVKVGAHKIVMPARPYLGIDDADRKEITAIVEDHFAKQGGVQ
ncbi:phage virion morphogenesis protein [Rhizobium sp. PP-CC-2G-626]|nr:phage virion morphogenesis protein [Rhizobium sp. PP-CC-2G-626]